VGGCFLLIPAHPGCPGQSSESRKTVVCVCVCVCVSACFWYRLTQVVLEKRLLSGSVCVFVNFVCVFILFVCLL